MTIKDELHELIEAMEDERAQEALAFLRALSSQHRKTNGSKATLPSSSGGPLIVSAEDFFSEEQKSIEELAKEQGVLPLTSVADLAADFWTEDDSVDEFLATIRAWRHERDV